jgi:hypothetical protein
MEVVSGDEALSGRLEGGYGFACSAPLAPATRAIRRPSETYSDGCDERDDEPEG